MIEKRVTNLDALPKKVKARLKEWERKESEARSLAHPLLEGLRYEDFASGVSLKAKAALEAAREWEKISANKKRAFTMARKKYPAMTEYALIA